MKKAILLLTLPLLLVSCGAGQSEETSSFEIPTCTISDDLKESLALIVAARGKYNAPIAEGRILAHAGYKTGDELQGNCATVLRLVKAAFSSLVEETEKIGSRSYMMNNSVPETFEFVDGEDEKVFQWFTGYGFWGEAPYIGKEKATVSFTRTLLQRIFSYLGAMPEDDYFTYVNSDRLFDSSIKVTGSDEYYKQYLVDENNISNFYVSFLNQESPSLYTDFTNGVGLSGLKEYADLIFNSSTSDFWAKATELGENLGSYFFSLSSVYSPESSPEETRVSLTENGTISLFEKAAENKETLQKLYLSFGYDSTTASSLANALSTCLDELEGFSPDDEQGESVSAYLKAQVGEGNAYSGSNLKTLKAMGYLGQTLTSEKLLSFKAYAIAMLGYNYRALLDNDTRVALGFEGGSDLNKNFLSTTSLALSGYFVNTYSTSEKGKKSYEIVNTLGKEIISTIQGRLSETKWLSEEGQKAISDKLSAMTFLVGSIDEEHPSFYGTTDTSSLQKALKTGLSSYWAGLREETKKNGNGNKVGVIYMETFLPNAMHARELNCTDITLGLMTSYGKELCDLNDEELYGALATVLGHEITHAIDSEGVFYSADGAKQETSILGETDSEAYVAKQEGVKALYTFEALPGILQDSSVTLSENIADIGGLTIAERIYKSKVQKADWKSFYRCVARHLTSTCSFYSWNATYHEDVHSFGKARVDALLSNSARFISTYKVSETDGMFTSSSQRVVIW